MIFRCFHCFKRLRGELSVKNQPKTNVFSRACFWCVRGLVKLFYPKITVEGQENLPDEPCILVGNHTQMNGPICGELYLPMKSVTWCAWQMMHMKEVPAYAYRDFWSQKPKYLRWFYKLLSYIIAPLSACIFNNASTIPVYHDARLLSTFRSTVDALQNGTSVLIFPECYTPHNHIVNAFQDKFVDVAKLYYKRTGKAIHFVPLYIAPYLKKMYIGKPVQFNPAAPIEEERKRICEYAADEITATAVSLPLHTVVPYANLPKKAYKTNIPREAPRKTPAVDYRKLRPSNITSPEYRHLLLLLGWVGYFILYFLTENLIPAANCYPVHSPLDDLIPFCEWFVLPYVGWYLVIVVSLLYFMLYNIENFKNLQKYIMITQAVAMLIYICFPTRQDLRPVEFPRDNFLADIVKTIYFFDTNTGVCPSLHVAYSFGLISTWLREKSASKPVKVFLTAFLVLVCVSVAFVKQHSVVDIFAALPVCLLAEFLVFGIPRLKKKKAL